MKTCKACGNDLPLEKFHRDNGSKDGYRTRCKRCVKAYDDSLTDERNRRARERYADNPADKIGKTRQYHLQHPEWSKERLRAHHVAHRAERYERHVERGKNPVVAESRREAVRRSESRRRAAKRGAVVELISEAQFRTRLAEFDGLCYICSVEVGANLHWDHYQPLARGGAHVLSNLFPACDLCNVRKNACWPFTENRKQQIRQEVRALRERLRTAGMEVIAHGN